MAANTTFNAAHTMFTAWKPRGSRPVCIYGLFACIHACIHACAYMYVCMHNVCMLVCMYVCMHAQTSCIHSTDIHITAVFPTLPRAHERTTQHAGRRCRTPPCNETDTRASKPLGTEKIGSKGEHRERPVALVAACVRKRHAPGRRGSLRVSTPQDTGEQPSLRAHQKSLAKTAAMDRLPDTSGLPTTAIWPARHGAGSARQRKKRSIALRQKSRSSADVCMYACMYGCMHECVCMYVCMCMYVCSAHVPRYWVSALQAHQTAANAVRGGGAHLVVHNKIAVQRVPVQHHGQ